MKVMANQSPQSNESFWRRKLSPVERAALRAQPEQELEARLTEALATLPEVPVASNFTARVLAAVELAETQSRLSPARSWTWRLPWLRVVGAAAVVLFFVGVGLQRYTTNSQRAELAKKVVLLASAQPIPSVEFLENLDAIQRMSQPGHADNELLAVLQ